jgi:hypothetical protein
LLAKSVGCYKTSIVLKCDAKVKYGLKRRFLRPFALEKDLIVFSFELPFLMVIKIKNVTKRP